MPGLLLFLLDFIGNCISSAPATPEPLHLLCIPTATLLLHRQLLSEDMPAFFVLGERSEARRVVLEGLTHKFLSNKTIVSGARTYFPAFLLLPHADLE